MSEIRYRAVVSTSGCKYLGVRHATSLPRAFEMAWEVAKEELQKPLPQEMSIVVHVDAFDMPKADLAATRQAFTLARTVAVGQREKADCDACGFPDVVTNVYELRMVDSLNILRMGDFMAILTDAPPASISSPVIRKQEACECCEMLREKGINPKTKQLTFLEGRA